MRRFHWLLAMSATPLLAVTAQITPPTGVSVASRAAAVHLDATRAATVTAANRTATFIPLANVDLPPSAKSLESGAVVGALTVTGAGGALAPGQYHVFVSKTGDGWQAVLEREGKIATSSRTVAVANAPERAIPKPLLQATGDGGADIDNEDSAGLEPINGSVFSLASYRPAPSAARDRSRLAKLLEITVGGKDWSVTITIGW